MDKFHYDPKKHRYTVNGKTIPGVTEILEGAGLVNLTHIRHDVMEAAQNFGTASHVMAALWDKGELDIDKLSAPLAPYLEGWKKFKEDYKISFKPNEIEQKIYCERYGFAGRFDRVTANGILIDIKSGAVSSSVPIQLAGYKIGYENSHPGQKIKKRWCVQLTGKGYIMHEYKDKRDETIFLSALTIYNFRKEKGLWKTK